ncbi:hypothetical protein [Janthinobacterium sp.]|uniref:hypothetical protein n=1 Tax=Janthinobacterium sp. TaxID=1871054 RepID=UPI00293D359D|nr:hypothetical protein [Janthinobacterium sp.]
MTSTPAVVAKLDQSELADSVPPDDSVRETSSTHFIVVDFALSSEHIPDETAMSLSVTPATLKVCQAQANPRKMQASRV